VISGDLQTSNRYLFFSGEGEQAEESHLTETCVPVPGEPEAEIL